ncbi:MAG: hypothetical protein KJ625_00170 [Actinobacteria bacterium]|nr:hypothetical protein [Actinomycetota bacterium]
MAQTVSMSLPSSLAMARFLPGRAIDSRSSVMCADDAPQQFQSGNSASSIPSARQTASVDSPNSSAEPDCEHPGK